MRARLVSWSGVIYDLRGFTKYEEKDRKLTFWFGRHKMKSFNLKEFFFWEVK